MLKTAVVASTGGGVLNAVLSVPYMQARISTVLSDRECKAIEIAKSYGIHTTLYPTQDALEFSNSLAAFFLEKPYDLVVSFYTRLFRGKIISQLQGKLINFHPSILPACPGMDGFNDTIKSGSTFIGSTLHFIDTGMDTGFPIIQSAIPYNPRASLSENRHKVFVSQCKMFIQAVRWFEEGRVSYDPASRPVVFGCQYDLHEFSPNLDFKTAINFSVDIPKRSR